MVLPIVAAGAAAVARFIVKNGFKMAMKKFGRKAAEEGAELAAKSKPLPKGVKITSRDTKLKYGDLNPGGANNPAIQQAKPTRMPAQKTTQGPVNPKGMGFSKGGKVQRPAKIF